MRGIDLRLADSRLLRRLRRILPLALVVCGALLVPECPECVLPVLAAAFLLWRALAAVDPAGWRLAWRDGAGWTLGDPDAPIPVRLDVLGCFSKALWLGIARDDAVARRVRRGRAVCVMADALEEGDWRRLRRRLRLDAAGSGDAPAQARGSSTVSRASGEVSG